jgi:hypothetical protein
MVTDRRLRERPAIKLRRLNEPDLALRDDDQ